MKNTALIAFCILAVAIMSGCGKDDSAAAGDKAAANKGGAMAAFVTTQDGIPLTIKPELFATPAAKEFLATGKNPYIGNAEAIAKDKKYLVYIPVPNATALKFKARSVQAWSAQYLNTPKMRPTKGCSKPFGMGPTAAWAVKV